MLLQKQILIISSNTLIAIGLKVLLTDLFRPDCIFVSETFDDYYEKYADYNIDFIFLFPDDYIIHIDHFHPQRNRIIILSNKDMQDKKSYNSGVSCIEMNKEQTVLVNQLENIFTQKIKETPENTEELSNREIEVLKLVSLGNMNKQIADTLNISANTVISHRKNITRKLGINTVSGLTLYALINGIISSEDIHSSVLN